MNLRGIANSVITSINPNVLGTVRINTGSTTDGYGKRAPTFTNYPNVPIQVQALAYDDLRQIEGLQLQGVRRKAYVTGTWDGVIRGKDKGGDVIVFPPGTLPQGDEWLVAHVLEYWPEWTAVVITNINPSVPA